MYKRNLFNKINRLLSSFPAVVILGARQTGKTTLAKLVASDWQYFDLEKISDYDFIDRDREFFFSQNPNHLILDEAQIYPKLFDTLRGVIDADREKTGRFILTGSSSPELLNNISESLAGRVAIIELATLKANEFYQQDLSDFYKIFQQNLNKNLFEEIVLNLKPKLSLNNMQDIWYKGGYPEPLERSNNNKNFYYDWMENYNATYINRDLADLFPGLNKITYNRFLKMLGQLSGNVLNKNDLARSLEISEASIRNYLAIAEGTYLWRLLPSFENNILKSTIKMPKGHIRDSGLLHYLLKIKSLDELYHHPIVGKSFESFVIEEIIKGMQATEETNYNCYYYRTRSGSEVDLVLHGFFGVLPIEIKYGSSTDKKQLRSLNDFIERNNLSFGLLINQSSKPQWLTKNIFQLPVNYL